MNCISSLIYHIHVDKLLIFALGLIIASCLGNADTGVGVAKIGAAQPITPDVVDLLMTQEEIANVYVMCLREKGLNVSDPTVNHDGTIDWLTFKIGLAQNPNYRDKGKREPALESCSVLLAGITISDEKAKYNDIELQDQLLEVTECLRSEGIYVADPDFSGSEPDLWWSALNEVKGFENARVERILDNCYKTNFGQVK